MALQQNDGPSILTTIQSPTGSAVKMVVEMRVGAHLYGTATARSDIDLKAVYVPAPHDILLQRVQATIVQSREKPRGTHNAPGDVDRELYSLQRYLDFLAAGQPMALDMLFAPDWAMLREPAPVWREIQANASRLVTRRASFFVRYCRQQANRYGFRGGRVAAVREALAALSRAETIHGSTAPLVVAEAEITALVAATRHTALLDLSTPGERLLRHLDVCGRKIPFTASLKIAREIVTRLVGDYGQRALQAEQNQSVDWKGLSHAVRVAREAVDLFTTGRLVFPLPYAADILAIKQGERSYESVAEEIERYLGAMEAAALASSLPEAPDQSFIDDLVVRTYRTAVLEMT